MSCRTFARNPDDRNREIALVILNQLGFWRFLSCSGARDLAVLERALLFSLPSNKNNSLRWTVFIALSRGRRYRLTFEQVGRAAQCFPSVHWEQLESLIFEVTGVSTRGGHHAA